MACCDKNVIHDSMIQKINKNEKVIWWHGVFFHVILIWDLVYPSHNFLIKNYQVQHAIIQNDWKTFKKMS
jgi:hypothetical protein